MTLIYKPFKNLDYNSFRLSQRFNSFRYPYEIIEISSLQLMRRRKELSYLKDSCLLWFFLGHFRYALWRSDTNKTRTFQTRQCNAIIELWFYINSHLFFSNISLSLLIMIHEFSLYCTTLRANLHKSLLNFLGSS